MFESQIIHKRGNKGGKGVGVKGVGLRGLGVGLRWGRGVGFKEVIVYYFSSAKGCNGTYRETHPEARERP